MLQLTTAQIEEYRAGIYHLHSSRVTTREEAIAFVNERGFVFFWPVKDVPLPSLWAAVAGDRPVPAEHDDPGHVTWGWKDELLGRRSWYYAKVLRKRATLIALDTTPYFYALSQNYGDYVADYLEEYREGRLSAEAKSIYEALLEHGPMHTIELRKKARMIADTAKYRFEKALTELQTGFKVLPVGVATAGAWHYAFIYDIVARYYPDLPAEARPISRRSAQQTLIAKHLESVGAASQAEVFRTLDVSGWTPGEFGKAVGAMIETGQIAEARIVGYDAPHLVSKQVLNRQ